MKLDCIENRSDHKFIYFCCIDQLFKRWKLTYGYAYKHWEKDNFTYEHCTLMYLVHIQCMCVSYITNGDSPFT